MVAIWLMPARDAAEHLTSLIGNLAAKYDAPLFDPHVTLDAGRMDPERTIASVQEIAAPRAFELAVEHVGQSENFTKTLFVQFRPSEELQQFVDLLRKEVGSDTEYQLNPHLSLIYKRMFEPETAALARSTTIEVPSVTFDRLRVITGPDQTKTREDVESWQILAERKLG